MADSKKDEDTFFRVVTAMECLIILILGVGLLASRFGGATPSATAAQPNQAGTNNTVAAMQSPYNFLNLTGVGLVNGSTGKLMHFVAVNNVTNVSISLNRTSAGPGELFKLNVTFSGMIYFNDSPAAHYYIFSQPRLINNHYFGVQVANESGNQVVQSNGPWYYFFVQVPNGASYTSVPSSNSFRVTWYLEPTANVVNETLKFCGGFFASYANSTAFGGWNDAYDFLALKQIRMVNSSVINIPGSCEDLRVV